MWSLIEKSVSHSCFRIGVFLCFYCATSDPYKGTCFETPIASLCFIAVRIQSYKYAHAKYFPRCLSMRRITDASVLKKDSFKSVIFVTNACHLSAALFKVTYSVLKWS